jgi:hypothetical protein
MKMAMDKTSYVPKPVKLFIGMLSREVHLFDELKERLKGVFGPCDLESPVWDWGYTDYYTEEMGEGLKRQFIFFQGLIGPEDIGKIKLKTNEIERQYLNEKGGRRINLDPGYLDMARVVLVSTKDYSHRIYLGDGIYGEVTLIYRRNAFHALPYTYPDFRTEEYRDIFKQARDIYKKGLMIGHSPSNSVR